jgi:hypothetical protein
MPPRPSLRRSGRRPLPPERLRRFRLEVRLAAAELATVRRRAARARLSTAAYARIAALRGSPPRPVPILNIRLVGQLGRLANNLNQLAKLAHQGRVSPALLPCLGAILGEVRKLRRELIGLDPIAPAEAAASVPGEPGRDKSG